MSSTNEQEKILCEAKIRYKMTIPSIIVSVIWWIIAGYIFHGTGPAISTSRDKYIWNINYYDDFYIDNVVLLLGIIITIIVFTLPLLIKFFHSFIAKRCKLTLTDRQIYGALRMPFSTKKLQIPIEKLDTIMISTNIRDKFRSGQTMLVRSTSGLIRFHYVHNADEFVTLALQRIEDEKKKAQKESSQQPAQQQTAGNSTMDKINELNKMKSAGLITEAEFEQKRQEIISNM